MMPLRASKDRKNFACRRLSMDLAGLSCSRLCCINSFMAAAKHLTTSRQALRAAEAELLLSTKPTAALLWGLAMPIKLSHVKCHCVRAAASSTPVTSPSMVMLADESQVPGHRSAHPPGSGPCKAWLWEWWLGSSHLCHHASDASTSGPHSLGSPTAVLHAPPSHPIGRDRLTLALQ